MVKVIEIDALEIIDKDSFHSVFSRVFGFPDFYGRNMDAWIDCMTNIDNEDTGLSKIIIGRKDTLVIDLKNSEQLKTNCFEIYMDLLECTSFVNSRKVTWNEGSHIAISLR